MVGRLLLRSLRYSILSWQHHTVLKEVVLAIMSEQQKLQQDKAIGMALPGADTQLRFGSSEAWGEDFKRFFSWFSWQIALILDAMLVLRLYRGNNPWLLGSSSSTCFEAFDI